jgi:hypothetical protein
MMSSGAMLAVACLACVASVASVALLGGCDTPPVSPSSAGAPTVAPAHASPDPPPARPVIVEDAGRADAGGATLDAADDAGAADGGAGADGGAAAPHGKVPLRDADEVIAGLRPRFRACYARQPKENGRPRGRLVMTAEVSSDGSVLSVTPTHVDNIGGRLVTCMVDVLKGARFAAPGGQGSTLEVPVSFEAP